MVRKSLCHHRKTAQFDSQYHCITPTVPCVQEYWRLGLRDADRHLSVPGRGQAGDLPEHLAAQRELQRGGAAAAEPGRRVLHPDAAPQTPTVSAHALSFSLFVIFKDPKYLHILT